MAFFSGIRIFNIFNPYKPGVPFFGHRQTVQTQIRRSQNKIKMKKVQQTPLKRKMDSSN